MNFVLPSISGEAPRRGKNSALFPAARKDSSAPQLSRGARAPRYLFLRRLLGRAGERGGARSSLHMPGIDQASLGRYRRRYFY